MRRFWARDHRGGMTFFNWYALWIALSGGCTYFLSGMDPV